MRLVTVAHGTRKRPANAVAAANTALAAARLDMPAVTAYVELCDPLLTDVLAASPEPTIVVPLLLSTGYHLRHDLPRMAARSGARVVLGRALGPHALLAEAQVDRLLAAGATPGQPVVMVAAGSTDPLARRDLDRAAHLLGVTWGAPVRVATLSGLGERPADVVRPADCVSPYLLAGGLFADRAREVSLAHGASVVADVIGTHSLVVELICRRAATLLHVPALTA